MATLGPALQCGRIHSCAFRDMQDLELDFGLMYVDIMCEVYSAPTPPPSNAHKPAAVSLLRDKEEFSMPHVLTHAVFCFVF